MAVVAASLVGVVLDVVERKAEDGKRLVEVMMARVWGVRVTNAWYVNEFKGAKILVI